MWTNKYIFIGIKKKYISLTKLEELPKSIKQQSTGNISRAIAKTLNISVMLFDNMQVESS